MITLESFALQVLAATMGFAVSWIFVTLVLQNDRKSVLAKVTAEQLKVMNSRTRAAEATASELKKMLANFQIIIDSQQSKLRDLGVTSPPAPLKRGYDCTLDFSCLCAECVDRRSAGAKRINGEPGEFA